MAATEIYCDYGLGDDTTGDGTQGDPYKTMQKAHDVIKARGGGIGHGTDTTVWLRDTAPYEEDVAVEQETTATFLLPLVIEGYTDTPGDGGIATFDGTDTKANAFRLLSGSADDNNYWWVVKNIEFKRYTSTAWDGQPGSGHMAEVLFQHCRFGNNVIGVEGNRGYSFLDCWFHDNGIAVDGAWLLGGCVARCIFEDNDVGLNMSKPTSNSIWNCLFIGNRDYNISSHHGMPIVNCVIDGKNKASAIGVRYPGDCIPKIINTIILDCVVGVQGVIAGAEELSAIFNSCFYLNTDNFTQGAAKRTGCIFADPLFVDRDNKDYGIQSASPCKEAGLDLKSYDFYTSTASKVDIGLLQEARSLSGGSGIGAPLGFSVER